jgi:DNA polymerase III delta prime subunit
MPVDIEAMMGRLTYIAGQENVTITKGQLNIICAAHGGDLRNSINALQAFASFSDYAEAQKFLRTLTIKEFDSKAFLKLCFTEKDFNEAHCLLGGNATRDTIRSIFRYAVSSHASSEGKLRVINAAITAERDIINGVDEDITKANFVRMLLQ